MGLIREIREIRVRKEPINHNTFMKIALAQLNYHIGNFEGNLEKMQGMVIKAKSLKADIVVFGELASCGYPPRDFLEFEDFIAKPMLLWANWQKWRRESLSLSVHRLAIQKWKGKTFLTPLFS